MSAITNVRSLAAYSFSHFCIDFCCFFILIHGFKNGTDDLTLATTAFLVYNVIAFGIQPLTGYLSDISPNFPGGLIGCALVAAGVLTLPLHWFSLAVCAVGNAFFHTAGGIDSLKLSGGRMGRSGIFVSTGALGVSFGTWFAQGETASSVLPLALIAVSALAIAFFGMRPGKACSIEAVPDVSSDRPFAAVLVLALLAVAIRSFAGSNVPMQWKTASAFLALLPGIGAFLGKAAGGILGDLFGARRVGVLSLVLSVPLLILGNGAPAVSFAGVVLFNMTMPITLSAVCSKLPDNPGLAFGLTTLALLFGNVPIFFFSLSPALAPAVTAVLTGISALCVYLSVKNKKGTGYLRQLPVPEGSASERECK